MDQKLALALNVVLASVGPWLILYYHKLVDWDEPWQPELNGDWPAVPYLAGLSVARFDSIRSRQITWETSPPS